MTDDTLAHYGTPRHSGRYPWGSGEDPYQDGLHFMSQVEALKKKGLSTPEIVKGLGFTSSSEYRNRLSISSNAIRAENSRRVLNLRDKGMSKSEIGRQLNMPESTVRALLNPVMAERSNRHRVTADILKTNVDKYKYVDVGKGTSNQMGISDTQLKTSIALLKDEGYKLQYANVLQAGTGLKTSLKVLTHDTTPWTELNANVDKIHQIRDSVNPDTGEVMHIKPPVNVSSKRVGVIYGPDGGAANDGVIYLRPGVPDISLGGKKYAQVRIAVDGTHYIKGMAMYKSDMPPGHDILFNTNKSNTGNKLDALKAQEKDDPTNPFGSITKQRYYTDAKGKEHQSVLNIVNEEGDWYKWSNKFSSQFLSKQTPPLAKEQLALTLNSKKADFSELSSLTNPEVKRKLLQTFADEADSSAVKLKATGLPRTATHVILPINSLKDTEIYAPKFNNGETVVLVRHPHGGRFEIPQLTVNNSNKEAQSFIKGAMDAVGINANVAERLSGADFDGDTVLVIPNNSGKVKTQPSLASLKGFNPKEQYALPKDSLKGLKGAKNPGALKQQLMGDVSNLITDMTIGGANPNEIARAVKHSMVVIDAEKHNLDYKQSAIDNNVNELKRRYQNGAKNGASTLISRTTSEANPIVRKARPASLGGPVDKATGEKKFLSPGDRYFDKRLKKEVVYEPESYIDKHGNKVYKTYKTTKGAATTDARTLLSKGADSPTIERIFADHANALKALANEARKEIEHIENIKYQASAKEVYAKEVKSLNAKLNLALKNAPLERQAQILAASIVKAKVDSNPGMDKGDLKKLNGMAITAARARVGATKKKIDITDEEWNAIQSGAVTASKLRQIVENTDVEQLRTRATPRAHHGLDASKVALAESMMANGYNVADIATRLGVSTSTVYASLNKEGA